MEKEICYLYIWTSTWSEKYVPKKSSTTIRKIAENVATPAPLATPEKCPQENCSPEKCRPKKCITSFSLLLTI